MTTVVCFKVPDGIVFAADSAMTVTRRGTGDNRYDSYHKLSVICGLPMGTAMWGRGVIGQRSVPSLIQEFSATWTGENRNLTTVEAAANELFAFLRQKIAETQISNDDGGLHLLVGGYSPQSYHGQVFQLDLNAQEPRLIADRQTLTISWYGVTEAIQTLWWGHSPVLRSVLQDEGLDEDVISKIVRKVRHTSAWGPERLDFSMPLQNAIDLAGFLVGVEIAKERYSPGLARSALPVDILVLRSDGPTWVRRKEFIAPPSIFSGIVP